jgi:diguanylate cyclase (GGDEF)-like protein
MDPITAGIALIVVQLCVALVMAGIFYATPSEKSTRYWALSALFIALGVLMVILNNGAPRPAVLIVGNSSLTLGAILLWVGIRAFYKMPRSYTGWIIGALFFVLFGWMVLDQASITQRSLLSSGILLILFVLIFRVIQKGQNSHHSFASVLTLSSVGLLIASQLFRFGFLWMDLMDPLPSAPSSTAIIMLYMLPLAVTILNAAGLMLLYFERIVEDKHYLATHDELTGMLNRRAITSGGEREVEVALRLQQQLTVAFIDIDYFKQINDRLGHDAGDRALVEVAQVLKQTCRNIDLIGRYGGEEFLIVLPGVDRKNAALVGQRLVNAVQQYTPRDIGRVTVSVGLATLPHDGDVRSWSGLIKLADAELYKAKSLGRNRFSLDAEPPDTGGLIADQLQNPSKELPAGVG